MRLRRAKQQESKPLDLPDRGEPVIVATSTGGHMPARVAELKGDTLLVAISVPIKPFSARDLDGMQVLFNNEHGRIRLSGEFSVEDPSEPGVLRVRHPRSIEVLQERQYVRIKSARPVIVYRAGDEMEVTSFSVDLSGGGILLAGPDNLKAGDEVRFSLSIQPGYASVTGKGRVVRCDEQGRNAVCFEQISDFDRRRLVRFIFECQRQERRRGLPGRESHG